MTQGGMKAQATGSEQALLRLRAERLARPPAAMPPPDAVETLEFSIAGQPCVLETGCVREVQALRGVLPSPLAARPVLGLVQLRGRLLAVLDLAQLLGLSGPAEAPRRLLVLGRDAPAFAVTADEVHGLRLLSRGEAQRRSQALAGIRPEIVSGTTADGRLWLDGGWLLRMHAAAGAGRATADNEP